MGKNHKIKDWKNYDYLFTVDRFGISASKDDVLKYSQVDIDTIVGKIKNLLNR